jgi:polar amino acid transport system substrate-binding protein
MIVRLIKSIAMATAVTVAVCGTLSAQITDGLDFSEIEQWRLRTDNVLRFCQLESNPTAAVDSRIGEAIAQRLLLNASFAVLGDNYGIGGEYAAQDIYVNLVNDCDIILGMGIGAGLYPPEFTTTRPYVGFAYVGVARAGSISNLSEISEAASIGGPVGSYGFTALTRYVATLPSTRRPRLLPYGETNLMLTRLRDETIDAMVIYGPVLAERLKNSSAQDIATFDLAPQAPATVNIGGLMLSDNTYLRTTVDAAIASMIADGTIETIVADAGFANLPFSAGGY